jgi:hypothetical protein
MIKDKSKKTKVYKLKRVEGILRRVGVVITNFCFYGIFNL